MNVLGTSRVLEEASQAGCKWFIFGSSREVYGEPTSFPVMEDDGVNPINHYGHAKVEGERMVREHCEQHRMAHSNLRFSNVYGHPGDHPTRLVNAFLRRALKSEPLEIHGGGQVFDFTHLDDTVSAIYKSAETLHENRISLPPIHVLPGKPVSIEDLSHHVCVGGKAVGMPQILSRESQNTENHGTGNERPVTSRRMPCTSRR